MSKELVDTGNSVWARHILGHKTDLDQRFDDLANKFGLSRDARVKISMVLKQRSGDQSHYSSLILTGLSSQKKLELAGALASSLEIDLIYVDCEKYPERAAGDDSWNGNRVTITTTKTRNNGEMVAEQAMAFTLKPDTLNWISGAPPGFVLASREEENCLAKMLLLNPNRVVFLDNFERAGANCLRYMRNCIEAGRLHSVPHPPSIHNSIFIFATRLATEIKRDRVEWSSELRGDALQMFLDQKWALDWRRMMGGLSGVEDCSYIVEL